ncbi:unnamed protein product, partial [Heterosigma akashiwo]
SSTLVFHFKTKGITRNLLLKRQLLALSTSGLTHERKYFWEVAPEEEIPITGLSIFTASSEAFDLRRPHEGVTCEVSRFTFTDDGGDDNDVLFEIQPLRKTFTD